MRAGANLLASRTAAAAISFCAEEGGHDGKGRCSFSNTIRAGEQKTSLHGFIGEALAYFADNIILTADFP